MLPRFAMRCKGSDDDKNSKKSRGSGIRCVCDDVLLLCAVCSLLCCCVMVELEVVTDSY